MSEIQNRFKSAPSAHLYTHTHTHTHTQSNAPSSHGQSGNRLTQIFLLNIAGMSPASVNQQYKVKYIEESVKSSEKFVPVFVINETHLKPNIYDAEVNISEYNIHRSDRTDRKGGGTAVYVHQSITIDNIEKFSDSVSDAVLLYSKHLNLVIIGMYRPPSGHSALDIHTSFKQLLKCTETFWNKLDKAQIILMGDLNLPSINWNNENITSSKSDKKCAEVFLQFLDKHLLTQHVHETTRKDLNTLDLIVTNIPDNIHSMSIEKVSNKLSDHDQVNCLITDIFQNENQPEEEYSPSHPFDKLNFNKANWNEIRENLKNINWNSLNDKEVEDMCSEFETTVINICDKSTPKHKKARNNKHFIPADRRALIKLKSNLNHKINLSKYITPEQNAKKIEKLTARKSEVEEKIKTSMEEESKRKEIKMLNEIKTNPKALYAYAKRKRKVKSKIGPLEGEDGKLYDDPEKIANILQQQYKSVFSNPDIETDINIESPNLEEKISDLEITEEDFVKAINLMPANSAGGPDKFPACILKECKYELAKPLMLIWRKSLDTGIIPQQFLQQTTIPIYKKNSKAKAENYRPVSLTSHLIKLIERILRKKLVEFIEQNNLITKEQYGFRSGRSCMSQLLCHYEKLISILEESGNADVLYLDMSKAFDKVDHKILLRKLKALGIEGKVHQWLTSFLTNREQTVMVDGHKSKPEKVLSGVPQGTVLGPLLFILYINDIVKVIRNSYVMIFADDSKIVKAINSLEDRELFSEDMIAVTEWATANKMELNKVKYQLIQYGRNEELKMPYNIDCNTEVKNSETVTDLGVIMSANMKFNDHIIDIKNKAKKVASWIFRIVESRSAETVMLLYKTYVRPILEYSCSLWSPQEIMNISALEAIQRTVTSKIEGMEHLNYDSRLKALNLYSLQRRRQRYDLIHIWKIQQGIITNDLNLEFYLNERQGWKCRRPIIQSRQRKLATVHNNAFSCRAATLFNGLPKNVKKQNSLEVFKATLDNHLQKIPDLPPVHGYVRANKNSILDWPGSVTGWTELACTVTPSNLGEEPSLPAHM